MKMSYDETVKFLSEELFKNISSENEIRNKLIDGSLNKSETLFNAVQKTCKLLYENKSLDLQHVNLLKNLGVKIQSSGWFVIDTNNVKGSFINANAVLKNVFCEMKKCHETAYYFMLHYKFENMYLCSGKITPYEELGKSFLHSICLFNKDGKEFVFDGANYLIMEKTLYMSIFKFQSLQKISRAQILADRKQLALNQITSKGIVKSKVRYTMTNNINNINKRFNGIGFVVYLYNREALVKNTTPIKKLEVENNKAIEKLNKRIKEMQDEDYKF